MAQKVIIDTLVTREDVMFNYTSQDDVDFVFKRSSSWAAKLSCQNRYDDP